MTADEQHRHAATMAMLEKMAAFVDEQLAKDEERHALEQNWRERRVIEKQERGIS